MLLFQQTKRFSVDIDLIVDPSLEKKTPNIVLSFKDDVFYRVEEDVRKPSPIRKRHFKCFYHSSVRPENSSCYVLLDVVFSSNPYHRIERRVISFPWLLFREPPKRVSTPSASDLLGDKLCAFAPHTVGVLFQDGKDVETIKQMYDVARLLEYPGIDLETAFKTYEKLVKQQSLSRGLPHQLSAVMDDTLETCRQIIAKGKRKDAEDDYSHLRHGFDSFHSFLPSKYTEVDWLRDAARIYMYLARKRFRQSRKDPASNNGTFVGRRYRLLRLALKDQITDFMIAVANDPKA